MTPFACRADEGLCAEAAATMCTTAVPFLMQGLVDHLPRDLHFGGLGPVHLPLDQSPAAHLQQRSPARRPSSKKSSFLDRFISRASEASQHSSGGSPVGPTF